MRQLTHNQVVELRACKYMDNPQMEFFSRIEKMMDGDAEAEAEIKKLLDQYLSLREILKNTGNAFGAEAKSTEIYNRDMDEFLKKVGFTPEEKKPEPKKNIFQMLKEFYS